MYIQPVESPYISSRNEFAICLPPDVEPVNMPADMERYNNSLAAPLFDLQLSQVPTDMFTILAPPQLVFQ